MADSDKGKSTLDEAYETLLPAYPYSLTSPKPIEFVIDGFIANKLTLIAGAPGVGKSTALVSMAAIAAGIVHVEGIAAELKRTVFYITEDAEQVERILYGMRVQGIINKSEQEVQASFKIIHAKRRSADVAARMVDEARFEGIERHTSGYMVEPLIILDTANAVLDLDNENDNSEASKAIAAIKEVMDSAAIWIIGHTAKAFKRADLASLSFRGASAFEGDTNATSYLFREDGDDKTYWALGKHRYGSEYQEVQFDTFTGSVMVPTNWGTEQRCFWRVGYPSRSSAKERVEAQEERSQAANAESLDNLKRRIVSAVQEAQDNSTVANRRYLRDHLKGKTETLNKTINGLVSDGYLKDMPAKNGSILFVLKAFEGSGTTGNNVHENTTVEVK